MKILDNVEQTCSLKLILHRFPRTLTGIRALNGTAHSCLIEMLILGKVHQCIKESLDCCTLSRTLGKICDFYFELFLLLSKNAGEMIGYHRNE